MLKIVFFGSPDFAIPSLEAIAHDGRFHIEAVVTQPDKPKGRSLELQATPIARAAEQLGIPVIKPPRLTDNAGAQSIRPYAVNADLFVVVAYGALLPASLLSVPKYGTINLHPSLLPKYRGASPLQAAILNGDRETGVTVMLLDEELDHGPVLWQEKVPIEHRDTAASLAGRLAGTGAKLIVTTIPLLRNGGILPQPQDHALASYTRQLAKEDGRIDWAQSADRIERMVRAFYPWPGAWTLYRAHAGPATLKICEAAVRHQAHALPPGQVCRLADRSIAVACGANTMLKLVRVQPKDARAMPGDAFVNGHQSVLHQALGIEDAPK